MLLPKCRRLCLTSTALQHWIALIKAKPKDGKPPRPIVVKFHYFTSGHLVPSPTADLQEVSRNPSVKRPSLQLSSLQYEQSIATGLPGILLFLTNMIYLMTLFPSSQFCFKIFLILPQSPSEGPGTCQS